MERRRVSSGAPWEASVGYSRAVRVGDRVFVSGTTALGDDGEPVGDGDAGLQAARAIETIAAALAEVGASLRDVVRTRMFVVDIRRDHEAVGRAHAAAFADVRPAATMAGVSRLIDERMLVEIEVEAVVD